MDTTEYVILVISMLFYFLITNSHIDSAVSLIGKCS